MLLLTITEKILHCQINTISFFYFNWIYKLFFYVRAIFRAYRVHKIWKPNMNVFERLDISKDLVMQYYIEIWIMLSNCIL